MTGAAGLTSFTVLFADMALQSYCGINAIGVQTTLEGKHAVTLPLRFEDGVVLLGPIRIGEAPPLF